MNILDTEETLPLLFRRVLQDTTTLGDANAGDDEYSDYQVYVVDDDYSEDYLVPMWTVMLLVVLASSLMVACIVYCSYQHEWCGMKRKQQVNSSGGSSRSVDGSSMDVPMTASTPVKTFQDSTAFDRLPHDTLAYLQDPISTASTRSSSGGGSSITESPPGSPQRSFLHLATIPRCVLCSQPYQVGEQVTHSPQCHHEYHEQCLHKYWAQNNTSSSSTPTCPVCKEMYMVADRGPSQHFSSAHLAAEEEKEGEPQVELPAPRSLNYSVDVEQAGGVVPVPPSLGADEDEDDIEA